MPLFVGIQIYMNEAYRLFNIDMEETSNKIMHDYKIEKWRVEFYLQEFINKYLKSKNLTLECYNVGEYRYIIGYKIEEVSNNKYVKISHCIKLIEKLKYQFLYEIKDYNFDKITLINSEGEDNEIEFTEPYIIECIEYS